MKMAWPPVTKSLQAEIQTHQASRHHFRTTCRVCASRKVPKRTQPGSRTRQELFTAINGVEQAKPPNWRAGRHALPRQELVRQGRRPNDGRRDTSAIYRRRPGGLSEQHWH